MTIEDIEARIKEIETISDDDEVAHSMEDNLFEEVLTFIATRKLRRDNNPSDRALAAAALKAKKLDFARWCA